MANAPKISIASYARLVRGNANFRRLWLAQIISESGDWFFMVSLYALLLQFTGRAQTLGIAFVLQVLPQALTGPLAGMVNDRLRRKRVMISSDLARAVILACMMLVRSPAMVWLAYPLLALETVMWGLFEPARTSIIPNIVAGEEVIVANTLSSTTWSFNLFMGSALGGVVGALVGSRAVFALDSCSFVASALLIARMSFAEPHAESRPPLRWRDLIDYTPLVEGMRYVRSRRRLLAAVFIKAGLGVTGASWVMFPIMGRSLFPVSGFGVGNNSERAALLGMSALMGARGLGALVGPLAAAPWAQQRLARLRWGVLAGFFLYGTGYVALGFIRHAPLAYATVAMSHMGGAVIWVFSTTLVQLMTEDQYRGRVFSAELSFCTVMLALSAFLAGTAIDRGVGVRTVALATGCVTVASGVLWAIFGIGRGEAQPAREDRQLKTIES